MHSNRFLYQNYVIMHEIRSGLWYIFRSEDIASRGFKLALEGYQNKVFIDIMNVHDTEGRYTKLFEIVDSRGIADLDDALLEADQPELYRSLHNAINSLSSIETIQNLSQEEAIQRATIFRRFSFRGFVRLPGVMILLPHPAATQSDLQAHGLRQCSSCYMGQQSPMQALLQQLFAITAVLPIRNISNIG